MSNRYDSLFTAETKATHSCLLLSIILILIVFAVYTLVGEIF